eukprot:TRINITY_DN5755_c0_g1_i1.p1 TRINITY_DN5755_c0_g1~~TRINITY_DN5755_c0_g1_i1.p1  ORF type:complete len:363 (+),score=25.69 TRINITY_DN5755_c0_g1_i1:477-1565(+)
MTKLLRHLAIELDLDSDLDIGSMDGGSELDDRELDQPEEALKKRPGEKDMLRSPSEGSDSSVTSAFLTQSFQDERARLARRIQELEIENGRLRSERDKARVEKERMRAVADTERDLYGEHILILTQELADTQVRCSNLDKQISHAGPSPRAFPMDLRKDFVPIQKYLELEHQAVGALQWSLSAKQVNSLRTVRGHDHPPNPWLPSDPPFGSYCVTWFMRGRCRLSSEQGPNSPTGPGSSTPRPPAVRSPSGANGHPFPPGHLAIAGPPRPEYNGRSEFPPHDHHGFHSERQGPWDSQRGAPAKQGSGGGYPSQGGFQGNLACEDGANCAHPETHRCFECGGRHGTNPHRILLWRMGKYGPPY